MAYIERGQAIGSQEIAELKALHPTTPRVSRAFGAGLAVASREELILGAAGTSIKHGLPIQPVVLNMEREINAIDPQANADFRLAGLPVCAK